jgi:hypothetical protein
VSFLLILKWLRSPWVWLAILLASNAATWGLWRHAANGAEGRVAAVERACQDASQALVQRALEEQAAAWESIYTAQQNAVTRMAAEAGIAATNARDWKQRYEDAKKTPACQKWAAMPVECPTS